MAMKKKNLPELVPYIFEHEKFGKVRAINLNGEPLLVGRDIATALGYSNTRQALIDHVPDKFKRIINAKTLQQMASQSKGRETVTFEIYTNPQKAIRDHVDAEDKNTVTIRSGIPGNPNMVVVNESGMYALIFGSQLPAAKKFKRWVTNEVLPSIRETGSYTSPQYDFFHPSPEELERRSKITTTAGIIEDLEAHGIDWDWEVNPRIEIDEDGVKHLVYGCKLVIKHPEYEKLQKQRIAAKKSAEFLRD